MLDSLFIPIVAGTLAHVEQACVEFPAHAGNQVSLVGDNRHCWVDCPKTKQFAGMPRVAKPFKSKFRSSWVRRALKHATKYFVLACPCRDMAPIHIQKHLRQSPNPNFIQTLSEGTLQASTTVTTLVTEVPAISSKSSSVPEAKRTLESPKMHLKKMCFLKNSCSDAIRFILQQHVLNFSQRKGACLKKGLGN